MPAAVTLIGMQENGCVSLSSRAVNAVASARVLAGNPRLLAFFPQFRGHTLPLTGKLKQWVEEILHYAEEEDICVLASGDPLFYGIGQRLSQLLGPDQLEVLPAPSSAQQAFARLGLAWQEAALLSVHGRPLAGIVSRLQQVRRAAILTDRENHPGAIAAQLLEYTDFHWRAWVCEDLGGPHERIRAFAIRDLAALESHEFCPLNLMILDDPEHRPWGGYPGHSPDSAYQKAMPINGLITKQAVRAVAVANLALRPDSVVWDIGTGSGSVAIEAAKQAWKGEVWAVDSDPRTLVHAQANCCRHRVDQVRCIEGMAPKALADWPRPDAIFIGGTRGKMEPLLELCLEQLQPGGRLVLNVVTLDNLSRAYDWFQQRQLPVQVTQLNISESQPLGPYQRFQAQNPITMFVLEKAREAARDD